MKRHNHLRIEALDDRCLPSFSPAVSFTTAPGPTGVVTADFNNDGQLDLVTANTETVSFRPGDGSGGFGAAITSVAASAAHNTQDRSLAVGDFNNDGKLDLAMVNDYALTGYGYSGPDPSNGVSVMLGNGDGSFQQPLNVPTYPGDKAASVAVGDFNADGTMDLAVAATRDPYYPGDVYIDSGLASVLLGNGDGSFRIQDGRWVDLGYAWPNYPPAAAGVAVADFNGDGKQDFVMGTRGYETGGSVELVAMLLGDGQGNIASVSHWRLDHGWSMAAGDLNGDGDADLVTASGSEVKVRLGNGTGGFEAPPGGVGYAAGPGAFEVVLGDFNRDGKLDIATANSVGGSVSVHRGRGDGTFSDAEFFAAGPGAIAVAAGDFNGDGWLDVATANSGANTASVLINDQSWGPPPPPPTVSINDASVTEGNTGTVNATFTVTLSAASGQPVTVQYSTANGTATASSDFQTASGTLTFAPGETSKTISVAVLGDQMFEPNETFAVNLSGPTNATIGDGNGTGTIVNDDTYVAPSIRISDFSKLEGRNGNTNFTFTVTLSAPSATPVTVNYSTANGTATAGEDYTAASGTLTFAPGETTKTITIQVKGDQKKEADETFFVNLSGVSSNALLLDAQGIGTILNDD